MRRRAVLAGMLATALWWSAPAVAEVVPADYESFWLWGGVTPSPKLASVLDQARSLYILQGEIRTDHRRDTVDVRAQGIAVPRLKSGEVWLVYRADTLDWPMRAPDIINAQVARWRAAGNQVVGIQVDFDAATRNLAHYAGFLRDLRQRLRPDCRLSITGLLDWSGRIDPVTVNDLKGTIDELVIQTYQGRHTIPGYDAYLPALVRLTLPFKIGLVEAGDWLAPAGLAANPWFRGYVVFLINRK